MKPKTSTIGATYSSLKKISVALLAAIAFQSTASAQDMATHAPKVSVAVVKQAKVQIWDEFSGRIEPVYRVELRPRVEGMIQAIHFREGAFVNKGDLLITIDPSRYAIAVEQAQAVVLAAQAREQQAQTELKRVKRLIKEKAIAENELDQRTNNQLEAAANLAAAQAALKTAKLNLSYTNVVAPISGRIGKLLITEGNQVSAGPDGPIMATLVSTSPIYASFDATENTLTKLNGARDNLDQVPVRMTTAGTQPQTVEGHLQLINNEIDPTSGTVKMRASFANENDTLTPGQFVRIQLGVPNPPPVLLINERALGADLNKQYVLVVNSDNKTEYREVTVGATIDSLRKVTSGLKAGERIVVDGLQHVRAGAPVTPNLVPMDYRAELDNQSSAPAAE